MDLNGTRGTALLFFIFFGLPILWIFPPTERLIKLSGEQREIRQVYLESVSDILDTCSELNRRYTPSNEYTGWGDSIRFFYSYGEWYEWKWDYHPRITVYFQSDQPEETAYIDRRDSVCEAMLIPSTTESLFPDLELYYSFRHPNNRQFCQDGFLVSSPNCYPPF